MGCEKRKGLNFFTTPLLAGILRARLLGVLVSGTAPSKVDQQSGKTDLLFVINYFLLAI